MQNQNTQPSEKRKTSIGGQALLEGLMMIGPEKTAMAFLLPDGSVKVEEVERSPRKSCNIPLIRGCLRLFRQMAAGTKAMMRAAEVQEEAEQTASVDTAAEAAATAPAMADAAVEASVEATGVPSERPDTKSAGQRLEQNSTLKVGENRQSTGDKKDRSALIYLMVVLGLLIGVALFILLPNAIVSGIVQLTGIRREGRALSLMYNLLEAVIRIAVFILYMWLCSKQEDMGRLWMFHGAEHKTIACYEAEETLTVENVRRFSRFHPRCGTSFLIILVLIAALVFGLVGWYGIWLNLLIRLALIPVIAGFAYELLRYSGAHMDRPFARALAVPGLLLQRLTTREPEDDMLRVSIAAMEAVLPQGEGSDAW